MGGQRVWPPLMLATRVLLDYMRVGTLPDRDRRALLDALDAIPRDRSTVSVYERNTWLHDNGAHAGSDHPYAHCPRCEIEHPKGALAQEIVDRRRAERERDEALRSRCDNRKCSACMWLHPVVCDDCGATTREDPSGMSLEEHGCSERRAAVSGGES